MAKTKTRPSLDLLEQKLSEVAEGCRQMLELCEKLQQGKRGDEAYSEVMADIAVCGDVMGAKLESLSEIIESLEDAMPDND